MPAATQISLAPFSAASAHVSESDRLENFTISVHVHETSSEIKAEWDELAENCNATVYQSRYWSELCLETLETGENIKPQIVTGWHCGKLIFVLPLVLDGTYSKILRWIGGSHANICQGLYHPDFAHYLTKDYLTEMFHHAFKQVSGVGVICLENQPKHWNGLANPLSELPNQPCVNNSFGLELEESFDEVLAKGNAKRKRKKFRQQCRIACLLYTSDAADD